MPPDGAAFYKEVSMKSFEVRALMTPKAASRNRHGITSMGVIMHMSLLKFLRSRIVTIPEIIKGMKSPVYPNTSVGRILFNARYEAGKALNGYDFIETM